MLYLELNRMSSRVRIPHVKVDMYEPAEEAALRHPEYHQDFYAFLCEVISTARNIAYQNEATHNNLSSSDIYLSFCSMMQNRFGPLAMAVLSFWGVKNPGDIGKALCYLGEENAPGPRKRHKEENFENLPALELMLDLPFHAPSL